MREDKLAYPIFVVVCGFVFLLPIFGQDKASRKPDKIFLGQALYADSAASNVQMRVYTDSKQQRYIEVVLKENSDGSFTAEGGETAIFLRPEWIKPIQMAYIQSLIQTWRLEKEAKQ